MKKVLIACENEDEVAKIKARLESDFDVYTVTSGGTLRESFAMFDVALIDHIFCEESGADYIAEISSVAHIPILILAPPEDQRCAIEAIRAGAFNYVVKFGTYEEILPIAIEDAISRYSRQEQAKATIATLKAKIASLEELLGKIPQDVIESACRASGAVEPDNSSHIVKEIVHRFRQGEINLPSLPQINLKFQELINKGADYRQISELLKQDLAITSKLIMVSNSAMYRGMGTNRTLEQAVSRLGIGVTQQYVNIIGNRSLYTIGHKKYVPLMDQLWRHSLSCAYACQAIAKLSGQETPSEDDPFVLGLLHDIGKLILLQVISELEMKGNFKPEISTKDIMKITDTYHGQFGSALLKRWQFSQNCVAVALYHDNPGEADPISKDLLIIHFANLLVKNLGYCFGNESVHGVEIAESKHLLKLDEENISSIKKEAAEYMDNVGRIFS